MSIMHDYMDIGGTSPWMDKGRIMQEQLSRVKQDARTEEQLSTRTFAVVVIPDLFREPAFALSAKQWVPANKHAGKTIEEGACLCSLREAIVSALKLSQLYQANGRPLGSTSAASSQLQQTEGHRLSRSFLAFTGHLLNSLF